MCDRTQEECLARELAYEHYKATGANGEWLENAVDRNFDRWLKPASRILNYLASHLREGEEPIDHSEFRVWDCKIVVPASAKLPNGFDLPPRRAAIEAVESYGIPVLTCFSGWGGQLDKYEYKLIKEKEC